MERARIIEFNTRRLLMKDGVPRKTGIIAYMERVRLQDIEV